MCPAFSIASCIPLTEEDRGAFPNAINASDNEALETITKIIFSRQKDGQLNDSNLSKGEIFLIKRAFLNVWKRIRHRRIQYPTSKNNTFS